MTQKSIEDRANEALQLAQELQQKGKNWLEAHNALFGIGGKCGQLFPTETERTAFAKTQAHRQMTDILSQLPEPPVQSKTPTLEEASGNLHVRLPRSLHAALRREAEAEGTSLNQLIVAKLSMQLQALTHGE